MRGVITVHQHLRGCRYKCQRATLVASFYYTVRSSAHPHTRMRGTWRAHHAPAHHGYTPAVWFQCTVCVHPHMRAHSHARHAWRTTHPRAAHAAHGVAGIVTATSTTYVPTTGRTCGRVFVCSRVRSCVVQGIVGACVRACLHCRVLSLLMLCQLWRTRRARSLELVQCRSLRQGCCMRATVRVTAFLCILPLQAPTLWPQQGVRLVRPVEDKSVKIPAMPHT